MFTDEQLLSVLDGTAHPDLVDAVTQAMEADPALEDRMMALDPLADVIRDAVRPVSANVEPETFVPIAAPPRTAWWPAGLAAAIGGAAVYVTMTLVAADPAKDWMVEVAAYQALYSPQTISEISTTPTQLAQQFDRAGAAIGRPLPAEALSSLSGLSLIRTQILEFEGEAIAQIVFADSSGRPIAFCITQTGAADTRSIEFAERRGMESAAFARGGFEFLLIGGQDAAQIERSAGALQQLFS